MAFKKKNDMLTTRQAVLDYLNIKDFRNMTSEKTIELVSSFWRVDKDVQLAIIAQVPQLATAALNMAQEYKEGMVAAFKSDDEQTKQNLQIISAAVDSYTKMLERDDLTDETRLEIISSVNDLIGHGKDVQKNSQKFKLKALGTFAGVLAGLGLGVLAAIGVNSRASMPDFSGDDDDEDDEY